LSARSVDIDIEGRTVERLLDARIYQARDMAKPA
jgi:hypothetical protein